MDKLQQKGIPVAPSSPKETLMRLYRQHFPGSGTTRDDLLDFSSDEEADSQENSLPAEVSHGVRSLTNDQLYTKLKEFGEPVGPIVETTRGVYEKRLQLYLNSAQLPPLQPPSQPASTAAEFSATEEEEEAENDEDDDDGTPLQDIPVSRLGLSSSGGIGVRPGFTTSHGGVFDSGDFVESPLTSRTSATFTRTGAPLQTSLRARMGAASKEELGRSSSNHVQTPSGQQQQQQSTRKGWSPLLTKVAIAAVVVLVNVLIYANLEYFKSDVPVPSVLK